MLPSVTARKHLSLSEFNSKVKDWFTAWKIRSWTILKLLKLKLYVYIYSLSTHRGQKWAYFCSMGSGFRDTGRFPKLLYLGMILGHWPKCQKLHIHPLSTPKGSNWACFSSTGSDFRDTGRFSKLAYLGMKLGHWSKCHKLYFLNYPRVPNFTLFCSTAGHFQDIGKFAFPISHNVKFQSFFNFQNFYNKFYVDCYWEHSVKVWSKKNQNCRRISVLKFSLP